MPDYFPVDLRHERKRKCAGGAQFLDYEDFCLLAVRVVFESRRSEFADCLYVRLFFLSDNHMMFLFLSNETWIPDQVGDDE
jgi:hypothetical protein